MDGDGGRRLVAVNGNMLGHVSVHNMVMGKDGVECVTVGYPQWAAWAEGGGVLF